MVQPGPETGFATRVDIAAGASPAETARAGEQTWLAFRIQSGGWQYMAPRRMTQGMFRQARLVFFRVADSLPSLSSFSSTAVSV
jgi:hypothetical protein